MERQLPKISLMLLLPRSNSDCNFDKSPLLTALKLLELVPSKFTQVSYVAGSDNPISARYFYCWELPILLREPVFPKVYVKIEPQL